MNKANKTKDHFNLNILKNLKQFPKVKYVYCDLFDTLIHRRTHPNYSFKLWAKHIIREFTIEKTAKELGQIRLQSMNYISSKTNRKSIEIPYNEIIEEVFNRLMNNALLKPKITLDYFTNISKKADFRAEISVQFLNDKLIEELRILKGKGYVLYLISDFYLSEDIMKKILVYQKIDDLFNKLYISCSVEKSKEEGDIYELVLTDTNLYAEQVIMIGDNKKSDSINAEKYGLSSIHLKHYSHKYRNKLNLFGTDEFYFDKALKKIEKSCKNSDYPYSAYIIFFTVFIERLYKESRSKDKKDLFFLAREGAYLKKLFDAYQEKMNLNVNETIKTHYLKASRQSVMQLALKELHLENFVYLKKYGKMSANSFMQNLRFDENLITSITAESGIEKDLEYLNFLDTAEMQKLRENLLFQRSYEEHREMQKYYFSSYINSFDVAIEQDGITVVDVGWGGSMQDCLFDFFEGAIKVEGYYIGLKEIYNITPNTKRWGLNFTMYPESKHADALLMANSQLYEQLLSAEHGSTLAYCSSAEGYTVEFHQANEKWAHDKFFIDSQEFMLKQFHYFLEKLEPICYENINVQKSITDLALRLGLFPKTEELHFIREISQGFYQNIGNNQIGILFDPKTIRTTKRKLIIDFLISPEKTFRYIVKLKPYIFSKKGKILAWLSTPLMYLIYFHIKCNKYLRTKLLDKVNI